MTDSPTDRDPFPGCPLRGILRHGLTEERFDQAEDSAVGDLLPLSASSRTWSIQS